MIKSELTEKNVVVTGGTSGLGKALVIQLLEHGTRVATIARKRAGLDRLKEAYPQIVDIQGDLSQARNIHPIAGEIQSRLGDVDILINAASYLGQTPLRLLLDTECEDFTKVLETNVLGPFRLTKAVVPSMVLKGSGTVINISSDAALEAYPTWGSYSDSKAALDHMTRIFQEELRENNIEFLSVDPRDMATPMHFAAVPGAEAKDLRDPLESAKKLINLLLSDHAREVRSALGIPQ